MTAAAKLGRFVRRIMDMKQMDFDNATWQMIYLLINPQKVYKNCMYRKRSKDQWARDDPAFLVLLSGILLLASTLFTIVLPLSWMGLIRFTCWMFFVDFFLCGVVIATILWFFTNRYLRVVKDQEVEWGYCFDVHINSYYPMCICLHIILPLLYLPFLDRNVFLGRLLGNCIWFVAFTYYTYITFLGYTAIPFLKKTHIFLYPITFLLIFYVATVSAGWNISMTAIAFYHDRVTTF
uniref:Protein unc-50 homolog n=1 Tax=Rhabditophanes sp. KR3021 TaxID=114890 RepID=A0AC35TIV9_9BILA